MRIQRRGPLAVASRSWQGARERMVTLLARVTYDLRPVRSEVSTQVEPIRLTDRWVEGDRGASWVREPSDVAPMKESADILLVGKAYPPVDAVATEVSARLVVGEIDKTLRVTGPRRFGRDGTPLAPGPFREAPIDWTRTSGGSDTWNPVGVTGREAQDLRGESVAPTVVPFGSEAPSRDEYAPPVGFGPIAPLWGPRRDVMPPAAKDWIDAAPTAQLSWNEGSRPIFFQSAPPDQRLPRGIRADERIVLENLHPQLPRLVTNLPGNALHAVVLSAAGEQRPIEMQPDTLWIDTERAIATVTHRAAVPARIVDGKDVVFWMEGVEHLTPEEETEAVQGSIQQAARSTLEIPVDRTSYPDPDEFGELPIGTLVAPIEALTASSTPSTPFRAANRSPARTAPARALPQEPARTGAPFGGATAASPIPAPAPSSPALASAPPLAPPAPPSPPVAARPSWVQAAPPVVIPGPAPSPAPRAVATPAVVERIDTWKLHEQASARRSAEEPAIAPVERVETAGPAAAAPPPAAPVTKAAAVEVVWFDTTTEVATAGDSRTLREQLGRAEEEYLQAGEGDAGAQEVARRDVGRWFRRAAPLELNRLAETLTGALGHEGGSRPFVVVTGELAWSFDPRESLRAWIALGTPLAVDPRVKDAIENAERSMAESVVSLPDVLQAALDRLRDAVRANAKLIGSTPIDAAAERWLVEERGFARRRVWGSLRLRAHLHAKSARAPLPVYFPEAAGWEAPLSQRFPAHVLGEVRTRQDPTEAATVCLRAVALGIEFAG